ncbi:MAG: nitroreductase family deazaflavin-dependent oxidoreductase [Chloroflexi bacterium]|nr:nitroreductase family deazaflavin-dependent oxidoreductase [Chloroflexota bacterium]
MPPDPVQQARDEQLIADYRASGGTVPGPGGAPLLLLTTTGAKSGRKRATPLVYLPDGDRQIIFASHQGAERHPDWYHNLMANPVVTLELGGETFQARAVTLDGAERDEKWRRQVELHPRFGEYQTRTSRRIPVVALERL